MISFKNVSWAYAGSGEWALKNISVDIKRGEFIAVMGENGSGKSTFCRMINGLIPHSIQGKMTGTVTVDGIITTSATAAFLAKTAGMVFEDTQSQLFTDTVYDELAFGLENLLIPGEEIKSKIRYALDITGLGDYAGYPPSQLPGGQKQRLAIASALIMADKILIMDEPSSQLDSAGAGEVLSLIRDYCVKKGLTVVMATCSGEEAAEFADRICVLKNGYLAAVDAPGLIFANQKLIDSAGIQCAQVMEFARQMELNGKKLNGFPVNEEEAFRYTMEWYNEKYGNMRD